MREVDAPAGFGSARRVPPRPLEIEVRNERRDVPLNWGTVHCGSVPSSPVSPPEVGNGRAVACSRSRTMAGDSDGCADNMSAAVPATSGAEKLVPTDALKLSL